jgi:putative oxidoreductase
MLDLALLLVRGTVGSLLAGHGAQKLFGWFGGPGLRGTSGWLESMGLRPGRPWALAAAISEFGGGTLMTLGFLNPVGPLLSLGSMGMATVKVHGGKPIWVTQGGAELPLTNIAVATSQMIGGPGALSLDELLGTGLPAWAALPGLALVAGGIVLGLRQSMRETAASGQGAAA